MYVRKLLKDKGPVQGRTRRLCNAWRAGSDEDSREISYSSSSDLSSEKCTSRVATPPLLNFPKQLVCSLTSSEDSDSFLKSQRLTRIKMGLKKQMLASGITKQPGSPSSGSSSESRRAYRLRSGKRIDEKKKKSKSCPPPSKNFVVSSSSSYLIESSPHETSTDSPSSSQSALELHDESSSTQEHYSKEEMRNTEKIERLHISSPVANEEALVVQLKIPSWNPQHRLESLDVEYLVFKVPAMKTV